VARQGSSGNPSGVKSIEVNEGLAALKKDVSWLDRRGSEGVSVLGDGLTPKPPTARAQKRGTCT